MYDRNDPRFGLTTTGATETAATEFAGADYVRFYEIPPVEADEHSRTWWGRGQNFFLSLSEIADKAVFTRINQPDEYVVLLPDRQSKARFTAPDGTTDVDGFSLVIVPPGSSSIEVEGGRIVRLFSTRSNDLLGLPANAASYAKPHPNVTLFEPWPEPPAGYKVRAYSLDVPNQPGRFGRIFRCTTFMVNYLDLQVGPRDTTKLSPHTHPDFEQCSLAVYGSFFHHLRWPWTTNLAQWRPDDHELCGTPSIAVIPPPAIHTTRAMDAGENQLVDIFCPPRVDFSEKPGWVLNADEYPMP